MSFAALVEQLDALEMPVDGPSLAVAVRAHDRYTAKLSAAIGEFDESGEWEIAGWTSVQAWLRDLGFTHTDANVFAKNARKLRRLPVTQAAWIDGRLTGGQVKTICSQVIDRHVDLFAEQEAELVPALCELGMIETATAMGVWRNRADALNPGLKPDDRENVAWLSSTLDGRGHLNATLDAEGYAVAAKALEVADSGDLDVPAPLRRGEALVGILRFWLDNQNVKHPGRNRPHLNIVINGETLATDFLEGYDATTGVTLSPETLERYLCNCDLHRVMNAGSELLDYGRAVRTPPPELWNALVVRDQRCRWKGCDRPPSWCHAHHVMAWGLFGKTDIGNLVLLCEKHHGMLHRKGWKAVLYRDGTFEVTDPNGNTWQTKPPGFATLKGKPPGVAPPFEQHVETIGREAAVRTMMHALRVRAAA